MELFGIVRCLWTMGRGVIGGLPDAADDRDPIELFGEWFEAAQKAGLWLPESVIVATVGPGGAPSARAMLLKAYDENGFVFYTNYESRKGKELEANPRVALVIHWGILQRQVRIEGSAARISEAESTAYFHSRPRGSQIGAWASAQSRPVDERSTLEAQFHEYDRTFGGNEIPLPPFWGGYRVTPQRIEFWQGRANRLHDRLAFTRDPDGWKAQRLYP